MSQFNNATIQKAAKCLLWRKVTSRTVILEDGTKVTLGIMLPGVYEFGTEGPEIMEILSGDLKVLLPGSECGRRLKERRRSMFPATPNLRWKYSRN
jgi:uncharacterized protein YaiE (UPF0345 family)